MIISNQQGTSTSYLAALDGGGNFRAIAFDAGGEVGGAAFLQGSDTILLELIEPITTIPG